MVSALQAGIHHLLGLCSVIFHIFFGEISGYFVLPQGFFDSRTQIDLSLCGLKSRCDLKKVRPKSLECTISVRYERKTVLCLVQEKYWHRAIKTY